VWATYKVGRLLYGDIAGAVAALLVAFMPYHILVTRQVLLDGPETLFATLTLYALALWGANDGRRTWLYASGVGMGLTFLSKETGIVLLGAIYAFMALANEIRVRIIDIVVATLLMVVVIAPFPLTMLLAGGSGAGRNYLVWQLFRRANHEWTFYPLTVTPMIGLGVIAVALIGFLLLRRERSWAEKLLLAWILVPIAFFQFWPTKGFQYLLPIAPAFAILAGRVVGRWAPAALRIGRRVLHLGWLPPLVGIGMVVSLLIPSWALVQPSTSAVFLAGTGGVPGGREAGAWVAANVPANSVMMTVGPSMANILEFYGYRKAYGLSVSPNPLFRNPSYTPLDNPDLLLRKAQLQYIVWDSYSAERTPFFATKLLGYVQKYHGRVAHIESVFITGPNGAPLAKPVIVIYEVRP
jgi:4-amino-4-deoxy-L-arabinose transferase-like glycosyltransferase